MAATSYSLRNRELSDKGHRIAMQRIYPAWWGVPAGSVAEVEVRRSDDAGDVNRTLDLSLSVDYVLEVRPPGATPRTPQWIRLSVQERFRRQTPPERRDVTITLWNPCSHTPSEYHKGVPQWLLTGWLNQSETDLEDAVVVSWPDLQLAIMAGDIPVQERINHRTGQPFWILRVSDLDRGGLVRWRLPLA
ncbi:protein of unknown function [Candidatus Hydrogenisulfobacillus filiaventi]|uniref:Uncharacterized protein n=1 Tax=Candidatus Hydrogenisulfobacillus filiaventi TaxID=2707344 RepID=A0A6F8ZII3_9FIRM|nr:protein of unknown function [Candidatus Hydrogenisulfobacillus filiaventi]